MKEKTMSEDEKLKVELKKRRLRLQMLRGLRKEIKDLAKEHDMTSMQVISNLLTIEMKGGLSKI